MTLLHRRQFQDNNQIWLFMQNEGLYLWTCFLLCFAMVGICKSTPSPTRLFSHRGVWQLWGISSLVSLFPLTTDICQLCHISHRSISLSQFKHPWIESAQMPTTHPSIKLSWSIWFLCHLFYFTTTQGSQGAEADLFLCIGRNNGRQTALPSQVESFHLDTSTLQWIYFKF